jgi:hypothetical protein
VLSTPSTEHSSRLAIDEQQELRVRTRVGTTPRQMQTEVSAASQQRLPDRRRTSPRAPTFQETESRKATASPAMADDSSIGTIGFVVNRNQGTQGAVVRASAAALSASISATPPPPSAKP